MGVTGSTGWLQRLRERGVIRVAVSYAVIAWLLLQIADVTFEPLGVPRWVMVSLIATAVLGLPVAVALAWFYEAGDQGVTRDTAAEGVPRPVVHGAASLRRYRDHRRSARRRRRAAGAAIGVWPVGGEGHGDRRAAVREPEHGAQRRGTRVRHRRISPAPARESRRARCDLAHLVVCVPRPGDGRARYRPAAGRALPAPGQRPERPGSHAGDDAADRYPDGRGRLVDALRPAARATSSRCRTRSRCRSRRRSSSRSMRARKTG